MSRWKITWYDNGALRETTTAPAGACNVIHAAGKAGVVVNDILKIERLAI